MTDEERKAFWAKEGQRAKSGYAGDVPVPSVVEDIRARLLAGRAGHVVPAPEGIEAELLPDPETGQVDLSFMGVESSSEPGSKAARAEVVETVVALAHGKAPDVADVDPETTNAAPPAHPRALAAAERSTGRPGAKTRKCEVCPNEFEVNHRNRNQRTCSRKCGAVLRQKQRAESAPSAESAPLVPGVTTGALNQPLYEVWALFRDGRKAKCGSDLTLKEQAEVVERLQAHGFVDFRKQEYAPSEFTIQVLEVPA